MEASSQEQLLESKRPKEKLAFWWSILFITYVALGIGSTYVAFIRLPEDRPLTANPEEFIGFKARNYLNGLTSIGPRVAGSIANEVTAVNYLLKEIDEIILESNGLYTIETDVQIVSGKFRTYGQLHSYESMQNIVVKLTPKNSRHTNAVLINSHFDTVPTSPGGGDDGSMIAIMLGVLNSLTKSKQAVRHPIVFLLNGAEEKGLLAAHGFITQHKWAKDVTTLINLDAGGIGGKEILLQTGPKNTRLIDLYNKAARHPHGQVLAEEIFQTPSFPSGTDFKVFTEYSNVTGLDMVYISNGYVYHTYMDRYSNLDEGSLQHTGDNVLALARAFANSEELDENTVHEPTGRGVYFDVFGLFFVNYSEILGNIINVSVLILSLVVIGTSILVISMNAETSFIAVATRFLLALIIQIGSVVFSAAIVLALAYFLDHIGYTLSWYSQQWIMFGLYCCPFLFISGIIPAVFLDSSFFKRFPLRFNVMLLQHAQCMLLAASIGYLTYMQYRSTFLVTCTVLFYTLSMLINLHPVFQKRAHIWLLPVIICQAVPLLMNSYVAHIIFTLIIPLTGRSPGNPEIYIADYILAATILIIGLNIPIFNMFRNTKSILSIFLVVFLIDLTLVFTPIGFPYTVVTPQRHIVVHLARSKCDINGEITYRNPVFASYVGDRHTEQTLKDVASENNLKYITSKDDLESIGVFSNGFAVMEGYELDIPNRSKVSLISKEELASAPGTYRYTFRVDGGAKILRFFIKPLRNNSVVDSNFSLENEPPQQGILTASVEFGKSSPPYTFWVEVKKNDSFLSTLSIDLQSEYIDDNNSFNGGMERFFKLFPNWSVQIGFLGSYDVYEF